MVWVWSVRVFGEGLNKTLVAKALIKTGCVYLSYWEVAPEGLNVPPAEPYDPDAEETIPETALSRYQDPLMIRKLLDAKSIKRLDALAQEINRDDLEFKLERGDFCYVSPRAKTVLQLEALVKEIQKLCKTSIGEKLARGRVLRPSNDPKEIATRQAQAKSLEKSGKWQQLRGVLPTDAFPVVPKTTNTPDALAFLAVVAKTLTTYVTSIAAIDALGVVPNLTRFAPPMQRFVEEFEAATHTIRGVVCLASAFPEGTAAAAATACERIEADISRIGSELDAKIIWDGCDARLEFAASRGDEEALKDVVVLKATAAKITAVTPALDALNRRRNLLLFPTTPDKAVENLLFALNSTEHLMRSVDAWCGLVAHLDVACAFLARNAASSHLWIRCAADGPLTLSGIVPRLPTVAAAEPPVKSFLVPTKKSSPAPKPVAHPLGFLGSKPTTYVHGDGRTVFGLSVLKTCVETQMGVAVETTDAASESNVCVPVFDFVSVCDSLTDDETASSFAHYAAALRGCLSSGRTLSFVDDLGRHTTSQTTVKMRMGLDKLPATRTTIVALARELPQPLHGVATGYKRQKTM